MRPFGARLILLVIAVFSLCGCAATPRLDVGTPDLSEEGAQEINRDIALAAGQQDGKDYRIGADDLLEVTLFDIESQNGEPRQIKARVSQGGYITLPLVGQVTAAGRTTTELEEDLRRRFRKFIHDPQITVFIDEYRSYRISVVGYVEKPGIFEVSGEKTLLEALAMAGGLNKDAGRTVQVSRKSAEGMKTFFIDLDRLSREGDISLNLPLASGDVINVPKAGVFYVEGSVKKPGAYPLLEEVTVTQALATAGGPDERLARASGTTLFRKLPSGDRRAIPIDIAAIHSGRAEDIVVAADDVILVPVSGWKFVVDRFVGSIGMGLALPVP